jgi:hypothetical protein
MNSAQAPWSTDIAETFQNVRKSKGDQRRGSRDKLVFAIPIAANPILADMLEYCSQHHAAFCANFHKRPPPDAFQSFSPAEASAD